MLRVLITWAAILTYIVAVRTYRTRKQRTILDILPVCACAHPEIGGAHGPDACDLAPVPA